MSRAAGFPAALARHDNSQKRTRRDRSLNMAPAATTTDDLRKIVNRLKRAQGQLAAVISAAETDEGDRAVTVAKLEKLFLPLA